MRQFNLVLDSASILGFCCVMQLVLWARPPAISGTSPLASDFPRLMPVGNLKVLSGAGDFWSKYLTDFKRV